MERIVYYVMDDFLGLIKSVGDNFFFLDKSGRWIPRQSVVDYVYGGAYGEAEQASPDLARAIIEKWLSGKGVELVPETGDDSEHVVV